MSAIFGIWQKNNSPVSRALDIIENALCEWQCETRATWHDDSIGVGARLLYTTPESQFECIPFTHPEFPQLVLVADAWLDNRAELCHTLSLPPLAQATTCDSELILRAYAKWGDACADKLRGDFAFALWDAQKEQWYCARDFIGSKPFFYFDSPQLFCFASDVRGVLACPDVPNKLDEGMLAAYLVQSTCAAEKRRTFYQNIFKIPPAYHLVLTRHGTQLHRYWSPEDVSPLQLPTREAYVEHSRTVLEQAVANATRTNQRVGAHLSGGLDSTTVAILAARNVRERGETLNGYSWSPPPGYTRELDETDEREYIEMVCAQEQITPRYLQYAPQDAVQVYTRDISRIPREMVLREEQVQDAAAQDGVRIMLSGWGGDELFSYSGRGYLPELLLRREFGTLYSEIRRRIPQDARGLRRLRAYASVSYRQMFWFLMPDFVWRIHGPYERSRELGPYIQPAFYRAQRTEIRALQDPFARDFPSVRGTQTARLVHGHLTRRMESWATHGAKRGIVYRYPLLAREIVEFSLGAPPHLFYDAGRSRAILRNATRGILPETIRATRNKTEPVAIGMVGDTILQGTYDLYAQTRPRFADHPANQYVNVNALQAKMDSHTLEWTQTHPVLEALSCFYLAV